jgi:hypothetical protein
MAIAKRWGEPAFVAAREERPDLPLRAAAALLEASSKRKRYGVLRNPSLEERWKAIEAMGPAFNALAVVAQLPRAQVLAQAELAAAQAAAAVLLERLERW